MNDHTDAATSEDEPWPAWCHPLRAKDMLGVTAHIVRDMLVSGAHEELYEIYGIRPKEAKQSLHYVELAELRAWGLDEMIEATLPGQSSSEERLRRRIVLATKAEGVLESLHPGDAVLLLERSDRCASSAKLLSYSSSVSVGLPSNLRRRFSSNSEKSDWLSP